MTKRISSLATALTMSATFLLVCTTGVGGVRADPGASPSPPTVDGGSKTSGLAGGAVPQPNPPPQIQVAPDGTPLHPDKGPDTPGKTGLGNNDKDALGGADKGPGTQDVVPRNAQ